MVRAIDIKFYIKLHLDPTRIHPLFHYVKDNGEVKVTCDSHYQTKWTFNKGHLPNNARVISVKELFISMFVLHNEGYYQCSGRTINTDRFKARSLLKIMSK